MVFIMDMELTNKLNKKVGEGEEEEIEVDIQLMVENIIKGMIMKIEDSTLSRLHFHVSKEAVT